MDQLKIRTATLNDLPLLLEFEQGVIAAERPFDPTLKKDPTSYYDIEEMINADHVHLVVAEINKKLVGAGYAKIERSKDYLQHKYQGYLGFMYVVPEYRRKNINHQILDVLAQWCASKKIYELRLQVYNDNEVALQAYEKAGFTKHLIEMRLEKK